MARIIKDRAIIEDTWRVISDPEGHDLTALLINAESLPQRPIVPLSLWLARHESLVTRAGGVGVWLNSDEDPALLANDINHFGVIAINFPKFTDGRGYSTARLLRERYGYRGELRAIGEVLRDQIFYLMRCGFNAFAVRIPADLIQAQQVLEEALSAYDDFSEVYQASVDQPVPLFRRRTACVAQP